MKNNNNNDNDDNDNNISSNNNNHSNNFDSNNSINKLVSVFLAFVLSPEKFLVSERGREPYPVLDLWRNLLQRTFFRSRSPWAESLAARLRPAGREFPRPASLATSEKAVGKLKEEVS